MTEPTQSPAVVQTCIVLRNGSEVWIPKDKADVLMDALVTGQAPKFVKLTDAKNRIINTADIVEFCTSEDMNDKARIKNGEWKCEWSNWHARRQKCDCLVEKRKAEQAAAELKLQQERSRERTPEEQARISKKISDLRASLANKFGWKK